MWLQFSKFKNLKLLYSFQNKLYQEIKDTVEENNGDENLDFNTLQNMSYLNKVIKESLRLWGLNFFDRTCTKEYHFAEINLTIRKGMIVQFGGGGIMLDEKHFKDPMTFDPESHFPDDTLTPNSFFAFGQGPRNCIGMRFAYTMVRAGLVHSLMKFRFVPAAKTIDKWEIDPLSPGSLPKGGLHVKLESR